MCPASLEFRIHACWWTIFLFHDDFFFLVSIKFRHRDSSIFCLIFMFCKFNVSTTPILVNLRDMAKRSTSFWWWMPTFKIQKGAYHQCSPRAPMADLPLVGVALSYCYVVPPAVPSPYASRLWNYLWRCTFMTWLFCFKIFQLVVFCLRTVFCYNLLYEQTFRREGRESISKVREWSHPKIGEGTVEHDSTV